MYQGSPDQRYGHLSYSQHGEDLFLVALFENILGNTTGTYLDIGAHHPTLISNTRLLYDRGWFGVNVEANPNLLVAFNRERPRDRNICTGVSAQGGRKQFFMYHPEAGRNTFSEEEKNEFVKNCPQHPVREIRELNTVTINDLVSAHLNGNWPDLLSIDVEGWDYEILESARYSQTRPKVICTEVRHPDTDPFKALLLRDGYECVVRMSANLIFVHSEYLNRVR